MWHFVIVWIFEESVFSGTVWKGTCKRWNILR